jgi:hypothetical protein
MTSNEYLDRKIRHICNSLRIKVFSMPTIYKARFISY